MAWKKGECGNPGGRPKQVLELVRLARRHCAKAIKKARALLDDGDPRVVMAAAVFLRDTGMGKPSQVEFNMAQVPDDELLSEVRRRGELSKQREQRTVEPGALDS